MNAISRNDEVTEGTSAVLALALVLPILGAVIYGFEFGWNSFGWSSVIAMAVLALVYYLILRVMLRYRQRQS